MQRNFRFRGFQCYQCLAGRFCFALFLGDVFRSLGGGRSRFFFTEDFTLPWIQLFGKQNSDHVIERPLSVPITTPASRHCERSEQSTVRLPPARRLGTPRPLPPRVLETPTTRPILGTRPGTISWKDGLLRYARNDGKQAW